MRLLGAWVMLVFSAVVAGRPAGVDDAVAIYERGDYAAAAARLRTVRDGSPGDPWLHLWLGKALLKAHLWDESIRELEQAVAASPDDAIAHLWLGRAYGHKAQAVSKFAAFGWARKVVRQFETAVGLDPRNPAARFDLLEYYLEAPAILGGGRDRAERQVAEIAAFDPRLGFRARARVFAAQRAWAPARAELEKGVTRFPEHAEPWIDLAEFRLQQGDAAGAGAAAQRAVDLRPGTPAARLVLAAARVAGGTDLEAAREALTVLSGGPLTDEDPAFEEVFYWLGRACLGMNREGEARQAFETALRFAPDHDGVREALAGMR